MGTVAALESGSTWWVGPELEPNASNIAIDFSNDTISLAFELLERCTKKLQGGTLLPC